LADLGRTRGFCELLDRGLLILFAVQPATTMGLLIHKGRDCDGSSHSLRSIQ
jgi:hypothetical protein